MTIRSDNADLRLTEKGLLKSIFNGLLVLNDVFAIGRQAGFVSDERWASFEKTKSAITRASELLRSFSLSPQVRLQFHHCVHLKMFRLGMGRSRFRGSARWRFEKVCSFVSHIGTFLNAVV